MQWKGELDGDPLEAEAIHSNGEGARIASSRILGFRGKEAQAAEAQRERYTELAANGVTKWREAGGGRNEGVAAVAPSTDWNALIQALNRHEALEFQSLFVSPFKVASKTPAVHIQCAGELIP